VFVHQLPSNASNLRVRTWRRLQQLGAIPLKQAVYVLPDTPAAREDFEWLKTEVTGSGGDASVFAADAVDEWSDDALVDEFRRSRQEAYGSLARDVERALKRVNATGRRQNRRRAALRRLLDIFHERKAAIEHVDFFGSAGRDRVTTLLRELEGRIGGSRTVASAELPDAGDLARYRGRSWVTRPRPGVDRMSSAWLIRRFIDPEARFGFAADRATVPDGALPFDLFGVEFSHHGDGCTFETLCSVFGLHEPAVGRIAAIVHDLDLKDGRFGAPEAATVNALIDGLQVTYADDNVLLEHGMRLFDWLYRSFERSARSAGPRPVARQKGRHAHTRKTSRRTRR
jgi:hypothetical protein